MPRECIECGNIYFVIIQKKPYDGLQHSVDCEAICSKCGTTWGPNI